MVVAKARGFDSDDLELAVELVEDKGGESLSSTSSVMMTRGRRA